MREIPGAGNMSSSDTLLGNLTALDAATTTSAASSLLDAIPVQLPTSAARPFPSKQSQCHPHSQQLAHREPLPGRSASAAILLMCHSLIGTLLVNALLQTKDSGRPEALRGVLSSPERIPPRLFIWRCLYC